MVFHFEEEMRKRTFFNNFINLY